MDSAFVATYAWVELVHTWRMAMWAGIFESAHVNHVYSMATPHLPWQRPAAVNVKIQSREMAG